MSPGPSGLAIQAVEGGVGFWVHVQPGARRESVGPQHGDALRVAVAAAPAQGRANAACLAALASALAAYPGMPSDWPAGSRGRRKRIHAVADPADLTARLHLLATEA